MHITEETDGMRLASMNRSTRPPSTVMMRDESNFTAMNVRDMSDMIHNLGVRNNVQGIKETMKGEVCEPMPKVRSELKLVSLPRPLGCFLGRPINLMLRNQEQIQLVWEFTNAEIQFD